MSRTTPTSLGDIYAPLRNRLLVFAAAVTALGALGGWLALGWLGGGPATGGLGTGWLGTGGRGALSGALGGAITLLIVLLQLVGLRVVAKHPQLALAGLLGGFLAKSVLMLGAIALARLTPAINPVVLFLTLVVGILGSTAFEVGALARIQPILDAGAGTSVPREGR
ncbi:hypothetical protein ABYF34_00035 [Buchananella felis]|uniref:hypothetical protein n=1 Tax=Buchananella felis TaxID=3231492 RepID=UPI0035290DC4